MTSSCGAGRKKISLESMRDFSRKSLLHRRAYAKWGVGILKAPPGGIFNSSPVLTDGRVENQCHCAWLVYLSGFILLCSFFQLRWSATESWKCNSCFLARERGRVRENPLLHMFKFYVSLLPCRISHEQFYNKLFLTVKPGYTLYNGQVQTLPRAENNWRKTLVQKKWRRLVLS